MSLGGAPAGALGPPQGRRVCSGCRLTPMRGSGLCKPPGWGWQGPTLLPQLSLSHRSCPTVGWRQEGEGVVR